MINVLTVEHKRFDTRIWIKEIQALLAAGFEVRYFVADGEGDQTVDGVEIIDFGPIPPRAGIKFRIRKMLEVVKRSGLSRDDIVHFHDGIFVGAALIMALKGCKVIYDVHEDYPRQVLNSRFPFLVRLIWGHMQTLLEWISKYLFTGFIAATPTIANRFPQKKTVILRNFPVLGELSQNACTSNPAEDEYQYMFYVGGLTPVRGIKELVEAVDVASKKNPKIRLVLGGNYPASSFKKNLEVLDGWKLTHDQGWMDRASIASWLTSAKAGLVVLHPTKNYIDAYPVKLFEYMSAGVPVIASDFPLWREIIETSNCGLLVEPLNPKAIADAMNWIVDNPLEAEKMGINGLEAVKKNFNWDVEKKSLISFYSNIAPSALSHS